MTATAMTDAERIARLERVVEKLIEYAAGSIRARQELFDMLHEKPQQASGEGAE